MSPVRWEKKTVLSPNTNTHVSIEKCKNLWYLCVLLARLLAGWLAFFCCFVSFGQIWKWAWRCKNVNGVVKRHGKCIFYDLEWERLSRMKVARSFLSFLGFMHNLLIPIKIKSNDSTRNDSKWRAKLDSHTHTPQGEKKQRNKRFFCTNEMSVAA